MGWFYPSQFVDDDDAGVASMWVREFTGDNLTHHGVVSGLRRLDGTVKQELDDEGLTRLTSKQTAAKE